MTGKEKCKILKQIRHKIAQENDIAYFTSECKHLGDCAGTCPKCEAEVQYLEKELMKQKRLGKRVAVAGVAAAMVVAASACSPMEYQGPDLTGDVAWVESTADEGELWGRVAPDVELPILEMGEVPDTIPSGQMP